MESNEKIRKPIPAIAGPSMQATSLIVDSSSCADFKLDFGRTFAHIARVIGEVAGEDRPKSTATQVRGSKDDVWPSKNVNPIRTTK
jgi:hypothetical protein